MEALLTGDEHSIRSSDPSVQNLLDRFDDIEVILANDLEAEAIPCFAAWLTYRVQMVSVMAETEEDAYTIFETMNDRGLSLTMPEMMRGYLLSKIKSEPNRNRAADIWKQQVGMLNDLDKNEDKEDVDAIQNWLRARHAVTASQYRKGVPPGDYERIGNEFHRWVRDVEETHLELKESDDFASFIRRDFEFYTLQFARIWKAAEGRDSQLRCVEYIASQGFTLHTMAMLAPLKPDDADDVVLSKMRAVAAYVDIVIHRRLWNSRRIGQTSLRYPFFDLAKALRQAESIEDVVDVLTAALADNEDSFAPSERFGRNQRNGSTVRRFLARLTLHVEARSVKKLCYRDLIQTGPMGYDIEHVIANVHGRYRAEWPDRGRFETERGWIGGLLLIPSRDNRAMGSDVYEKKLPV